MSIIEECHKRLTEEEIPWATTYISNEETIFHIISSSVGDIASSLPNDRRVYASKIRHVFNP